MKNYELILFPTHNPAKPGDLCYTDDKLIYKNYLNLQEGQGYDLLMISSDPAQSNDYCYYRNETVQGVVKLVGKVFSKEMAGTKQNKIEYAIRNAYTSFTDEFIDEFILKYNAGTKLQDMKVEVIDGTAEFKKEIKTHKEMFNELATESGFLLCTSMLNMLGVFDNKEVKLMYFILKHDSYKNEIEILKAAIHNQYQKTLSELNQGLEHEGKPTIPSLLNLKGELI